jgi:mannose-6-phosphate isomerase-like protein (cupin superfamily)
MKKYLLPFALFNFNDLKNKNIKHKEYSGFNNDINLVKFNFHKNQNIKHFINYNGRNEFILVVISGTLLVNLKKKNIFLRAYDAINFFSNSKSLELSALKKGSAFLIEANSYNSTNSSRLKFFNFKKNIKAKNLWGGQCISKPYEGKFLTLVLFDLKKGFTFNDKGHLNRQITWIIKGKMNFYVNNKKFILRKNCGIDISSKQVHGGTSMGAVGFDVFFPKRTEINYKNKFTYE